MSETTGRAADPEQGTPVVHRTTARVLVVDAGGRVLLFRDSDPGVPGVDWWITPGGGVEPGETLRAAALREVAEETGLQLADADLRGPVAHRTGVFGYSDRTVVNDETYFLAAVPAFEVVDDGHTEDERLTMLGHRWWTPDELAATQDDVQPPALLEVLRASPEHPLELGRQHWSTATGRRR